jgi:hypothetical protein
MKFRTEEQKRLLSKKNIVSLFIVAIMVFSVIGFMLGENASTTHKYKGIKFSLLPGNQWEAKINSIQHQFDNFPGDLDYINISADAVSRLKDKVQIDITSDANDSKKEYIAAAEYYLSQEMNKEAIFLRVGFTGKNDYNFSTIKCTDATEAVPVVYFKSSNETKISLVENCIVAEAAKTEDVMGLKDKLIYAMLGVLD